MLFKPGRAARAVIGAVGVAASCGPALAQTYAVDFIATASNAVVMDPTGQVIVGRTTLAPACDTCQPTFNVPAIWQNGRRQLLSVPTGASYLSFAGANANGWIAGTAMRLDATGGAGYVWVPRPDGTGHDPVALGALPGYADALPAGIDDQNRVFGLARTWFVAEDPFLWTAGGGLASLTAMGYPADAPVAVSRNGVIATRTLTYTFGDPASVSPVAPPPAGFHPNTSTLTGAVNDAGMRASFLSSTSGSSQGYRFLARYSDAAGWQVLAGPVASSVPFGVGGIDPAGTITANLIGTGYVSYGPAGPAETLLPHLSAAYPEAWVGGPGMIADDGSIVAGVGIGRSARLVKMVPVVPCAGPGCLKVASIVMSGRMVSEPGQPGQCTPGAYNDVAARITVLDASGAPVPGAIVNARFLDDYYLDTPLRLRTNRKGQALARHRGAACVGAVALLVEGVTKTGLALDRTAGQLSSYIIPQPRR